MQTFQLPAAGCLPRIRAWFPTRSGEILWPVRIYFEAMFGETQRYRG